MRIFGPRELIATHEIVDSGIHGISLRVLVLLLAAAIAIQNKLSVIYSAWLLLSLHIILVREIAQITHSFILVEKYLLVDAVFLGTMLLEIAAAAVWLVQIQRWSVLHLHLWRVWEHGRLVTAHRHLSTRMRHLLFITLKASLHVVELRGVLHDTWLPQRYAHIAHFISHFL